MYSAQENVTVVDLKSLMENGTRHSLENINVAPWYSAQDYHGASLIEFPSDQTAS